MIQKLLVKKPTIIADYREKEIIELLKQNKNINVIEENLDVDFIIGDIGIERKSINDFINSIFDKRIFEQVMKKSNFKKFLIIVEGRSYYLDENEKEIKELNVKLNIPQLPLPRIKYEEAVQALNLNFGDEIKREHEKALCEKFGEAIFLTHFPKEHRPFYTMINEEDKRVTNSFDFLYRGLELASGAQRIHIPELLEMRIIENGLDPKDFKDYINAFRFGAPPHAGWAIGLERFTMKVCNLENIREAAMWPRDRYRLSP